MEKHEDTENEKKKNIIEIEMGIVVSYLQYL